MKILFKKPIAPNFLAVVGFDQTIGVDSFSRDDLKSYLKLWEMTFWDNYNRRKKLGSKPLTSSSW
jgi:hypothetical protein